LYIIVGLAVIILCIGYLAQIAKIHRHREVRDLSIVGFTSLAIAYVILGYEAYLINSRVFLIKNCMTFLLVTTILAQIWYHRDDEWHNDEGPFCECGNELENNWKFCPDCAKKVDDKMEK
jgi:uncharacterized protein with PQ loop repeat